MLRGLVIRSVFALTSCSALASCASSTETFSAPGSLPTPPAGSSAPVLLKDMVVSSLPSPYYHFEYDAAGQMTQASFASGLMTYALAYVSGRLDELRNNLVANNDRLLYTYDSAGRVGSVKYADASGEVLDDRLLQVHRSTAHNGRTRSSRRRWLDHRQNHVIRLWCRWQCLRRD